MLTKFIIRKGKIGTLFAILISINQRKYEKRSWSFTGRGVGLLAVLSLISIKKILTKKDKNIVTVIQTITDTLMKKATTTKHTEWNFTR